MPTWASRGSIEVELAMRGGVDVIRIVQFAPGARGARKGGCGSGKDAQAKQGRSSLSSIRSSVRSAIQGAERQA